LRGNCRDLERKCAELEKARDAADVARAMTQEAVAGADKGREGREGRNAIEPKAKVLGGGLALILQPKHSPKLKPLKNTIVPKVFSVVHALTFLTLSPSRSRSRTLC
jgi:hypothetical protein